MLPELEVPTISNQSHSLEAWTRARAAVTKARKRNVNSPPVTPQAVPTPIGCFWDSGENDWHFGLIVVAGRMQSLKSPALQQ
jgi:hypothetical protein